MRVPTILLAFGGVLAAAEPSQAALQEQPPESRAPMPEEFRKPFVASCLAAPGIQPVPKAIAEHICGCVADSIPKYLPRAEWDRFVTAAARQHAARDRGEAPPPLDESALGPQSREIVQMCSDEALQMK